MDKFQTQTQEVILFRAPATNSQYDGYCEVVLTSQNLFIQNEMVLIGVIPLNTIKIFNGEVYAKHNGNNLEVQSTNANITVTFKSGKEAKIFEKIIFNVITDSTFSQRMAEKIKSGFYKTTGAVKATLDEFDDTFKTDSRQAIKSGFNIKEKVKGALGFKKKKD